MEATEAPRADTSFNDVVAPFIKAHCVRCHGANRPKAKLSLQKITDKFGPADVEVWQAVLVQLDKGEMPPEDEPRPNAESVKRVKSWIHDRLTAAEKATPPLQRLDPDGGNLVDHDVLFSPKRASPTLVPATPARIWRVRPSIYESFIEHAARQPFRKRFSARRALFSTPWGVSGLGIKDYADLYWIGEAETELLINNAMRTAGLMSQKRGPHGRESQVFSRFIRGSGEVSQDAARGVIHAGFEQILRRTPRDEELATYTAFLNKNVSQLGRKQGLETTLAALLMHPEAVFRFELGVGDPDEHGRVRLAPSELAYAIAYALTDKGPDDALLDAARSGKLNTAAQVRSHVERILNDTEIAKPNLLRFFQEYFGYTRAPQVFKDQATRRKARLGGNYSPDSLVADTDLLILHILENDKNVLRELLTTDKTYMSSGSWMRYWQQGKDKLAARAKREGRPGAHTPFADKRNRMFEHYNFDPDAWSEDMPLSLNRSQRAGILTQPSWLIAHSTNFENHAIHRGKWIRDRLLGGTIPDTPITVEAQLPDDDTLTLRQKMRVTREAFCWKCHERMDPLGLPFEMYDHFGRFRESELGKPVDTRGAITRSGDDRLDVDVTSAIDLMHKLADSPRVRQVFVRHVFRYYLGRNETPGDAATLIAADEAYVESGGSFKALLASLLTSDAFIYRKPMRVEPRAARLETYTPTTGAQP